MRGRLLQDEEVDVLVIGAGIAGLVAALSAGPRHVTILCEDWPSDSTASALAQGGVAAACGTGDTPQLHAVDTIRAGAGECWFPAVQVLCDQAADAIQWLEDRGVQFDREGGYLSLHTEAAHSKARILHVGGDATGAGLIGALNAAARAAATITVRAGYCALYLCRDPERINGAVSIDSDGCPAVIKARDVVLATGGLGHLYRFTTNPVSSRGAGLAMALEAGARVSGLEFVQFHPTALAVDADPLPLITEALRGAGATLVDDHGERVMIGTHPALDLAPRDILAREIWYRMQLGRRIFLDATHVFSRQAAEFPSVLSLCRRHGINPGCEPIPVVPAAHYHMGGIAVDLEGRSSIPHLWACGEVASTGVHGANRLASNSLLEAVVFGRRLGAALALTSRRRDRFDCHANLDSSTFSGAGCDAVWQRLRTLMWQHVGIVRNADGLRAAILEFDSLIHDAPLAGIRTRQALRVAGAIASAALARRESRGSHQREDMT